MRTLTGIPPLRSCWWLMDVRLPDVWISEESAKTYILSVCESGPLMKKCIFIDLALSVFSLFVSFRFSSLYHLFVGFCVNSVSHMKFIPCVFLISFSFFLFFFPIADMRGFMTSHGQPDQSRSARYILKDYVSVSANRRNPSRCCHKSVKFYSNSNSNNDWTTGSNNEEFAELF